MPRTAKKTPPPTSADLYARQADARAKLEGMPDPGDEPIPNKRCALEAEQRKLRDFASWVGRYAAQLRSIEQNEERYTGQRDLLAAARGEIAGELAEAQRALDAKYAAGASPFNPAVRDAEKAVEQLEFAIDALEHGWRNGSSWRPLPRLVAALPDFDWEHGRPLSVCQAKLGQLDEQRARVLRKVEG